MQTRDLLFEIGTEELPSAPLNTALAQLNTLVPTLLETAHLTFQSVQVMATPRRIAVTVTGLAEMQPDIINEYKGPAQQGAFDADGKPTRALEGFARGKGIAVSDIEIRDVEGVNYVYAVVAQKGGPALSILPEVLTNLITSIDWKRSQRWGSGTVRFVRPVRWILAIFGRDIVPVEFGDLQASNITYGHRFLAPQAVEINALREYQNIMRGNHVLVDQDERRSSIEADIQKAAKPFGIPRIPRKILDEVVNLVEFPNAVVGTFDDEFLRVPREILEYAMSTHQRYFAIERPGGGLDNHFVVISNGDPHHSDQIARGHERVVRARLSDAAFFYDEDLKVPLETWLAKLEHVVFQEKLGTSMQKVERVEVLAEMLARQLTIGADQAAYAVRAAHLAKADLVTHAVVEFTDLQGVMGSYYALASGEAEGVATAIREHYQPRFSGDVIPSTEAGQLVSVADKMDTIAGIFAVGMAPKGTSDPFALRRNAIGIIQIALGGLPLTFDALISTALSQLASKVDFDIEAVGTLIKEFFVARLQNILRDKGYSYDTVDAVLSVASDNPADALARCAALESFRAKGEDMTNLSIGFDRAKNLAQTVYGSDVDESLLTPVEVELFDALKSASASGPALLAAAQYDEFLALFAQLRKPVDAFFENVMVMDPDEKVRANRMALLNTFIGLVEEFADLRKLA